LTGDKGDASKQSRIGNSRNTRDIVLARSTSPLIGQWYHYPEKSQKFVVTAIDDDGGTVEIQYFDGTIDEFELDDWSSLRAEGIAEPEDWTGPMDDIETDDLNPVGTEMSEEDWEEPYDEEDEKLSAGPRYSDEEE
jgi:hypothetical protein